MDRQNVKKAKPGGVKREATLNFAEKNQMTLKLCFLKHGEEKEGEETLCNSTSPLFSAFSEKENL